MLTTIICQCYDFSIKKFPIKRQLHYATVDAQWVFHMDVVNGTAKAIVDFIFAPDFGNAKFTFQMISLSL